MKTKLLAATVTLLLIANPAYAACSGGLATSFVSRMNGIAAGSGDCQRVLDGGAAYKKSICSVCNKTRTQLLGLRATFNSNKSCLEDDKRVRARINELWDLRGKVNKLEKLCG